MVIMKIMGGFASQLNKFLFGYMLAQHFQTEYIIDTSDYANGYFRPYVLDRLSIPDVKQIQSIRDLKKIKSLRKIYNGKELIREYEIAKTHNLYLMKEEKDYYPFFEKYQEFNITLNTPFIERLSLKEKSTFLYRFKNNIENQISVGIHIRRGDFTTLGIQKDASDYLEQMKQYEAKYHNVHFYFFSNDLQWAKKQFGKQENYHYVCSINGVQGDMEELFCLSFCQYRILTKQSGYGILAELLSQRKDKFYGIVEPENKLSLGKHEFLDKIGIGIEDSYDADYEEYLRDRYIIYQSENDLTRSKECLVKLSQYERFWQFAITEWKKIYQVATVEMANYLIITHEVFNQWNENGLWGEAIRLSRLGCNVYYVNISKVKLSDKAELQKADFMDARNMDGCSYHFNQYFGKKLCVSSLLTMVSGNTKIISDCMQLHRNDYEVDYRTTIRSVTQIRNDINILWYNVGKWFKLCLR